MEANAEEPQDKRVRYELLPAKDDGNADRSSASPFMDDMSDDVEAKLFEEAVVKKYRTLVTRASAEGLAARQADLVPPTIEELNERYRRLVKVGEGSFGEVYLVYDTVTSTYFTMKRMLKLLHRGTLRSLIGLHNTTFRELQLLTTLRHPNVIEVVSYHLLADGSLIMFMPAVAHDFSSLLRHWSRLVPSATGASSRSSRMPLPVVKCLFRQLLEGVAYLHRRKVIHRDLKPSNLMVGSDGVLKIIDFGWSRYIVAESGSSMTGPPCVVAYRAPEVLIGETAARHYTFAVDVWCCGCILFEMLSGGSLFISTRNEVEALSAIVDWLGSPSPTSAVYVGKRGRVAELPAGRPNTFRTRCSAVHIAPAEIDFLSRMLVLEPSARSRADSLLLDDWFTTVPAACTPPEVPLPLSNTYRFVEHRKMHRR